MSYDLLFIILWAYSRFCIFPRNIWTV